MPRPHDDIAGAWHLGKGALLVLILGMSLTGWFSGLCGLMGLLAQGTPPPAAEESKATPPTALAREAIRLLLSENPKEEARGEQALKRMEKGVAPQLRYWVRRVRSEADRVEVLLRELEGNKPKAISLETTPANEFLYHRLLLARDLARQGKQREALEIAEAVLVLDRESPHAWELRRLARRARHRLAATEVLEPIIEVDKISYEVGERPEVTFQLVNHRRSIVRVHLEKGILGEVDMMVTRQFLDGGMKRDRNKLPIHITPEVPTILIGAGRSWEYPVELNLEEPLPASGMVVRIQIAGRFRPSHWSADGEQAFENLSLPIPMAEFWIVPAGQKELCERPLEKLTAALLFGKLEPLFVAGWLAVWAGEDDPYLNERIIDTLISHVEEIDSPRLVLVGRFLCEATGLEFGPDPKLWKSWWGKVKSRGGDEPPAFHDGGESPVAPGVTPSQDSIPK